MDTSSTLTITHLKSPLYFAVSVDVLNDHRPLSLFLYLCHLLPFMYINVDTYKTIAAHLKLELFNDMHGDPRAICIRLCQVQTCNQG